MTDQPEILTIGYEGCTIDGVLETLRAARVGLLLDVRAVAASRARPLAMRKGI